MQHPTGSILLDPQPASVSLARDHVRGVLRGGPLAAIEDEAALLVSEVVTNAVLHAGGQVELHCRIERDVLCVEVRDRSPVVPSARHFDGEAMTGRGLGLVELLATAWGIEPAADGKTVWFQLVGPDGDPADLPERHRPHVPPAVPPSFTLRLRNVPAELLATTVQYGDTLLRELTLAWIAEGTAEGTTRHGSHIDMGPIMDAVREAATGGADPVDVDVTLPEGSGTAAITRLSLIEEADLLAREGKLLTTAELPEVAACRSWLLREIASQAARGDAVPWQLPAPMPDSRPAEPLPAAERARLDGLGVAAVVSDVANQIIYANDDAARLLGWSAGELEGRRLISIVPPELREAHLAGFGRYLLTREPRLLGSEVVVPALRRDGSRIDVTVLITVLETGSDRQVFLGRLVPVEAGGAG